MRQVKQILQAYLKEKGLEISPDWFEGRDGLVEREYNSFLSEGGRYNEYHSTSPNLTAHLAHLEHDSGIQYLLDFLTPQIPVTDRILDYGCGIGSLGIRLQEAGYLDVSFADVPSPSTEFLKWRLPDLDFYDLRKAESISFDTVACYNLLEHCHSSWKVFENMEHWSNKIVLWLNTRFEKVAEYQLHYNLDLFIEQLEKTRTILQKHSGTGYSLYIVKSNGGE